MRKNNSGFIAWRLWPILCVLLIGAPQQAAANISTLGSGTFRLNQVTCEAPIRLSRDCSAWQGATRPIALAGYRMLLAADDGGSTVLISRLRLSPDHNDSVFVPSERRMAVNALRELSEALQQQGILLQKMQPVRQGRRTNAWYLEFSGDAYSYLKQFTVLESEYWLPTARVTR
ncbi:MAG: hypothetical protein KDJ27_15490 [Gammaproteobacteria bacterium]|nr:hypothetical protein [Gammaproteobacteria bacterium]MCB1925121.1 hypothetical protein [Gammaproteobacteria bacterium]